MASNCLVIIQTCFSVSTQQIGINPKTASADLHLRLADVVFPFPNLLSIYGSQIISDPITYMGAKETIASTASEYPLAKFVIGQIPNP